MSDSTTTDRLSDTASATASNPASESAGDTAIEVVNARTHNLKGVSCRVPHGRVTVVTGPSGAGKSSLAFDTVFAEGQRRFVESMSTYARQFLDQMERPPVDSVDNIQPAVALEATNSIKNARSTVGTITEAYDVLRLLFTHLGEVVCPHGHGPVARHVPEEVAKAAAAGDAGQRFLVVARVARPKKGADDALTELIRQGFLRRLDEDGELVRMEPGDRWYKKIDPMPLVLGRFKAGSDPARLTDTIEDAYRLGRGRVELHDADGPEPAAAATAGPSPESGRDVPGVRHYGRDLTCQVCGVTRRRPTPALFSFNSPLGACDTCQGFGRVIGIDEERVIPDPTRNLVQGAIAPWNTPAYEKYYDKLHKAAKKEGVPLDVPWEELSEEHRRWVWSGKGKFTSLDKFFAYLERKKYRVHFRVLLARYRSYDPCPDCGATRLIPEALSVFLNGWTIPELAALSVEKLRAWLAEQEWTARQRELAGHLLGELEERVEVLHRVGLDYLTLNRQARTLSGGETQRIHLAAALGSGLTSTLYVLDEPTIGLHPVDSGKLLALLADLAKRDNTVLVVEHDRTLIEGADHLIDLGPRAGEHGGELMAEGTVAEVLRHPDSLTALYLRDRPATAARQHLSRFRREQGWESLEEELSKRPRLRIEGARAHNLRGIDVEIPLDVMVAVTGVSGSGKSTLIENVLYGTYQRSRGVVDVEPGECDALTGLEELEDVTLVDQRPLGRSTRSNPVTYVKAYDDIRKLFAATPAAKRAGITPGHFSFNVDKGRCPECKGTGVTEVDMQFMAAVTVTCDRCQGRRFQPSVLAVRWQGLDVNQVLGLTVDAAIELFSSQKRVKKRLISKLRILADVGLGYLRLGQATSTLSGGEAQRLKLASFLDRPASDGHRLFLFDEPTTGLHLADIDLLYRTLRRLVKRGDGVIIVEHSPDLIARADWVVDLGPGGGVHGGDLLFSGPMEAFLEEGDSPSAEELRKHVRWAGVKLDRGA